MINWTTVGAYLDRKVLLANLADLPGTGDNLQLSDATVLVLYSKVYAGSDADKNWLRALVSSQPLAIAVAGAGARRAFDDLIELLSTPEPGEHTMTGVFDTADVKETISGFLYSTWPAEERFDNWKKLAVLVVGHDDDTYDHALLAIKEMTDRPSSVPASSPKAAITP